MKKLILPLVAIAFLGGSVHAAETLGEKVEAAGDTAKRKIKKGGNRTKEALCMEGDVECAAKKAGNRVDEAGDTLGDKAKKAKESVD